MGLENSPYEPPMGDIPDQKPAYYKPADVPSQTGQSKMQNLNRIVVSAVAILIIITIVYIEYNRLHVPLINPANTTPTQPIITKTIPAFDIVSCTTINSPGVYHVVGFINTNIAQGPCISIRSSNVALLGNNSDMTGSGPFVQTPPFSYGIEVFNESNVTLSNMTILKFSYDVFFNNTSSSRVYNVNALNATMSGIYLSQSHLNTINFNRAFAAGSIQGGIGVVGGGNNTIKDNQATNNAYYGLYINSTNNVFFNNTVIQNPIDIACGTNSQLRYENRFSDSRCNVNYYCDFASCSTTNLPAGVGSVVLSSPVKSCGLIQKSGIYQLNSNLNLSKYVNTSNPGSTSTCISITAPSVTLNCNNDTISNSYYGVIASSVYNTTLMNCKFYNNTYGIYLSNSFSNNVTGVTVAKSTYGLYLNNQSSTSISDSDYHGNTYGIYINDSSALTFTNDNANNNTYGIYYSSGTTTSFFGNKLNSNPKGDLYCTPQTYDSNFEIFQNNQCGLSDCNWASCASHLLVPLSEYPISNCGVISNSGNYTLQSVILSGFTSDCMTIDANNVNFNCQGHFMQGAAYGNAFLISGHNNVTITNCDITQYGFAINATNVSFLTLKNDTIQNISNGVSLINATFSQINQVRISDFDGYGFNFYNVNNSVITNSTANRGINGASGFVFTKSNKNVITFDGSNSNPSFGFIFNNSRSNLIQNNTAISNVNYDYACAGGSSGVYAESGLVNQGINKHNCIWMIEVNPAINPVCYAISASSTILLQQDMLYTYGATCYSVYNTNSSVVNGTTVLRSANNSIINCNGHTILATRGGTFLDIQNSSAVTVENCYLRGFTRAIVASGPNAHVLNDTIINSNYSIAITGASSPVIANDNFTNDTYGIYAQNSRYGTVQDNIFRNVSTAMEISGGSSYTLYSNLVNDTRIGLYLINTQLNRLQDDRLLNASTSGIECTQFAATSSSNIDAGGNSCSSNSGCVWMTTSSGCSV